MDWSLESKGHLEEQPREPGCAAAPTHSTLPGPSQGPGLLSGTAQALLEMWGRVTCEGTVHDKSLCHLQ